MTKLRQTQTWKTLANLPFIRHFSLRLGLACILLCFNVLSNGFDMSLYNQVQAMTPFQQLFGDSCNHKTGKCVISTRNLSLLNSIPYITYGITLPIAAVLGERFGRRFIFYLMNAVCLIGIGITYGAKTYGQLMAGRCIVNIYLGFESWLIPLYLAEVVPGQIRGTVMACYMFGRMIGTLIINIVTYYTAKLKGNASWQTPVLVMFAIPALVIIFGFVLPESPRWLVRRGKHDAALKCQRYISASDDDVVIMAEVALLESSLEEEMDKGSWADLFRGTNRRRTFIAMITNFFCLACGQSFSHMYQTIFLKSLGTIDPFFFTIISAVCGILGSALFVVFTDRWGRRTFWQTMAPLASLTMMTLGGLGTIRDPSLAVKNAIASMFCIFAFFFLGSFAQLAALTPAEITSPKLRDKTSMAGWSIQNLTNFVFSFSTPYLMNSGPGSAGLGSKVGFIFGSIGLAGCLWAVFFYPEVKGRSLEEIDEMMRQKVPAWRTRNWQASPESIGNRLTRLEDGEEEGEFGTEGKVTIESEHIERLDG